jgi:hypothetical protein
MRSGHVCAAAFAVCLAASVGGAQDAPTFIAGTYYKCDMSTEDKADAIYKETIAPVIQKQVEAGKLTAAGYGRHWMGGEWRRLEYTAASSIAALVEARNAIIGELTEGPSAAAAKEFDAVCPSHDDYIWSSVVSSQAPGAVGRDRTTVAMSTYFVCDGEENEADAIVKTAIGPLMNTHVEEGKIASWNWLEHIAGGKYRRLLVIDGKDHTAVLEYWHTLTGALGEAQPELARRFTDICDSHSDYIWDMGVE